MAHLFVVHYVTNHVNGAVETGKVVVVAESHAQAHDIICQQRQLPASRTRTDGIKVREAYYLLESRESHPEKKVILSHRGDYSGPDEERKLFHVNVEASNISGRSEREVLRRVGDDLIARAMQAPSRHNLQMAVDCWEAGKSDKGLGPMEKVEMYGARGGRVQGGQVRGK